ncbi:MAG: hypothetical protein KF832_14030 [Caldilineaceae bacterium]|nr:hypothetical protein [Caldilineaceae bacterium]
MKHLLDAPELIHPLDGLIGKWLHGPMHRFCFARGMGFTGTEVEMLLRQYGIRIWGREIEDDDEIAFHVKQCQAVWAEYILCRAGVPLTGKLLDPRNEQYRERHAAGAMPTPWSPRGIGPHSLVDHVVDWLNRLLG